MERKWQVLLNGCLVLAASKSAAHGYPYLTGAMVFKLMAVPSAPSIELAPIPTQSAQANSNFYFNLKPYITLSPIHLRYLVSNRFVLSNQTRNIIAYFNSMSGVPYGITQVYTHPNDCPIGFSVGSGMSCELHFVVNPNLYNPVMPASGPNISMLISWHWEGHRMKLHCNFLHAISPVPSEILPALSAWITPLIATRVTPQSQYGLTYDPQTMTIKGKPAKVGIYSFKIQAMNDVHQTEESLLQIKVAADPKDTPMFKKGYPIPEAFPNQRYQVDLYELIRAKPGFIDNDQIIFRIDGDSSHPDWLSIDKDNHRMLQGTVPSSAAGHDYSVTLIATSNSGGDSRPFTLVIPVSYDSANKPQLSAAVQLQIETGAYLSYDFREDILSDKNAALRLKIDFVSPEAPWLKVSTYNPLELEGKVPENIPGELYQITLHLSSQSGGDSDSVTIPLQITHDLNQTPRFLDGFDLPSLIPGQSYFYDFVSQGSVLPLFEQAPYAISFAPDHEIPAWLFLENNKLIAKEVPVDIKFPVYVYLRINNIPGGVSKTLQLPLLSQIDSAQKNNQKQQP